MNIAFLNRGREAFPGGDCIVLDSQMKALRKRGHTCVETGWDRDAMRSGNFDLAHIQHCNFSWSYGNFEAVRDVGLPYVLTPMYYPGPLLSGITRDQMHEIVANAKMVLPFSNAELKEFDWEGSSCSPIEINKKWRVIPSGTDEAFHHEGGLRFGVIAISARGDTDKNIAMVRELCDRIGTVPEIVTGVDREKLPGLLKYRKVFVNASGSERMSLTIGEALCAGCRVLATQENRGNEWYEGLVTFDPTDEIKLEHLIKWALESPDWDYRPNSAARCITWDWVAGKLEEVYREVLNG